MNLSRFYSIAQIEYCRNCIFKRHLPIHKIFERSCEIGLWCLTANRISQIFGVRLTKKLRGKIATVIEQVEHGHHVFRAYWKSALLRQYEKYSRFLRNELCSNNLRDFGLRKGLDHLEAVRKSFKPSPTALPAFRHSASMCTWISPCSSASLFLSPSARSAIPHQTPGHTHHPLTGSPPAWQQHGRRLHRQADSAGGLDHLPSIGQSLRAESAPL